MNRFKIAIVGCGSMAGAWVKYAMGRNDSQIVALVDINPENAIRLAKQHKLECSIHTDLEEAVKHSNPNLVFDITAVSYTHLTLPTKRIV